MASTSGLLAAAAAGAPAKEVSASLPLPALLSSSSSALPARSTTSSRCSTCSSWLLLFWHDGRLSRSSMTSSAYGSASGAEDALLGPAPRSMLERRRRSAHGFSSVSSIFRLPLRSCTWTALPGATLPPMAVWLSGVVAVRGTARPRSIRATRVGCDRASHVIRSSTRRTTIGDTVTLLAGSAAAGSPSDACAELACSRASESETDATPSAPDGWGRESLPDLLPGGCGDALGARSRDISMRSEYSRV
mmetsp:Transcript_16230/g.40767  ORF Transcript_16230/g.40767 Transcript_16230/m.40767 type:complete len:248 (-) Transcript_16230:266-1009(-)